MMTMKQEHEKAYSGHVPLQGTQAKAGRGEGMSGWMHSCMGGREDHGCEVVDGGW